LLEQYWLWLTAALRGNFGLSVRTGRPVLSEILNRFPLTLELALVAMLIAVTIGIPVGVASAVKRDSLLDYGGRFFALVGLALPSFWMGTLIIFVLSVYFQILPNSGNYVSITENPVENFKQIIFPAFTLGFAFSAAVMRTTRSALLEELNKDYAPCPRPGRTESGVISSLPANAQSIITLIGFQTGYLLAAQSSSRKCSPCQA
jgi:peptide/nickel transport system permease protein